MKKLIVGLAVLVLALLTASIALADSFTDPAGDSGAAPDITAVTVTNDAAGNLTFTVTTNQAALASGAGVFIVFDTDKNSSTGDDGSEFFMGFGTNWIFRRWDGAQYVDAATQSVSASYANGVLTFKLNKSDLAGVSSFVFWAFSAQFDAAGAVLGTDDAPDGTAVYVYTLTVPTPAPKPLTLRASAPVAVPAMPAAGKAFAVRVPVTRGDTGAALASGVATCKVTLGLKPLRAVGTVRSGRAACAMVIPKTARGKQLRGTIKVTFRNVSVTKSFSYRVR